MRLVYIVRLIRYSTNGENENFLADDEAAWTAAKRKLGVELIVKTKGIIIRFRTPAINLQALKLT